MNPKTLVALAIVGVLSFALPHSAGAHEWVPRYDGAKWAATCTEPGTLSRQTPTTCCSFARSHCQTACDLADVGNAWKTSCRSNCQSAGAMCLQRVQKRPPVSRNPLDTPPATTN
jgi:hypothetical protein